MASPPYPSSATSPPSMSHLQHSNSRKRPSLPIPPHGPNIKRQKRSSVHSSTSALSAHPLRQTSFPTEENALETGARSPSVDSDITGVTGGRSVITNTKVKRVRGKGKRKKAEGSVKSTGREKTVEEAREGTGEAPDEDYEDDAGAEGMEADSDVVDAEAEIKKMAVLMSAFNDEQTERYTMLRRAKLSKDKVRKIVNQTVSQSVPPTVITTVTGATKTFIGTLIERAREVQLEWAALEAPPKTPSKVPIDPTDFHVENPNNESFTAATGGNAFADLTSAAQSGGEPAKEMEPPKELGPLLPDHFREALRRYKKDGDGGGTGLTGVSVGLGMPGSGSLRLVGKRLFK